MRTRIFDGKRYTLWAFKKLKADANKRARSLRSGGHYVRVIKVKGGYQIYGKFGHR